MRFNKAVVFSWATQKSKLFRTVLQNSASVNFCDLYMELMTVKWLSKHAQQAKQLTSQHGVDYLNNSKVWILTIKRINYFRKTVYIVETKSCREHR